MMEKNGEYRKIQRVGRGSYIVTLPKEWIKDLGLDKGSNVALHIQDDSSLLVIPQKVLEPEGKAQKVGHHTLIRVKLPGVKEEDVDVRKLEESVEIKAYREHEAYFKQFQVPHDARIISKHMEGDELVVEVG